MFPPSLRREGTQGSRPPPEWSYIPLGADSANVILTLHAWLPLDPGRLHPEPALTCAGVGAFRGSGRLPKQRPSAIGLTDDWWRDNLSPEPPIPTALAEMASGLGGFSVRAFCPLLVSPRGKLQVHCSLARVGTQRELSQIFKFALSRYVHVSYTHLTLPPKTKVEI